MPVYKSEITATSAPWSDKELSAFVQFVALYHDSSKSVWPTHKDMVFWGKFAAAIAESTGLPSRSETACRSKIFKFFKQKFKTIDEAEEHFNIQYFDNDVPLRIPTEDTNTSTPISASQYYHSSANFSPVFKHSPFTEKHSNVNSRGQAMKLICEMFSDLTKVQRAQLTTCLYNQFLIDENIPQSFVPKDFLHISISAMGNLSPSTLLK
ncbi:uncharacterized protein LOC114515634 [Dendronephthya gigantea]|uniref:uncharacterized protein LOC114515634 n=1 Tax=Dendronephthya gigantea TaxID=151771 RepID=UPI00106A6CEC|nr:uncharacterized protein LOC114515634 [Dendronephthya gigantea]